MSLVFNVTTMAKQARIMTGYEIREFYKSLDDGGYGDDSDERLYRAQMKGLVAEIIRGMKNNVLICSKSGAKTSLILDFLSGILENGYALGIKDFEKMLPWSFSTISVADKLGDIVDSLTTRDLFEEDTFSNIRQSSEDHPTASQNAMQKLDTYESITITGFQSARIDLPAMLIAEDSDFDFDFAKGADPELADYKSPGAIKAVGQDHSERITSPLDISKYYGGLVERFGEDTDLTHLGLDMVQAIPITFNFAYAIALRSDDGKYRKYVYTNPLKGYLLPFDESKFNPSSPMIWIPDIEGAKSMPEAVKSTHEHRDWTFIQRIFFQTILHIQQLVNGNFEGWEVYAEG